MFRRFERDVTPTKYPPSLRQVHCVWPRGPSRPPYQQRTSWCSCRWALWRCRNPRSSPNHHKWSTCWEGRGCPKLRWIAQFRENISLHNNVLFANDNGSNMWCKSTNMLNQRHFTLQQEKTNKHWNKTLKLHYLLTINIILLFILSIIHFRQ